MQDLEEKFNSATLLKYGNNVPYCTREMNKLYKEIRRLKTGTYYENRFLTKLFCASEITTYESFERTVEVVKEKWIFGDAICTITYLIKTCNNKYRNLEGFNVWNKSSNKETKIIALTTKLNNQRMKSEYFQKNYNGNRNTKI